MQSESLLILIGWNFILCARLAKCTHVHKESQMGLKVHIMHTQFDDMDKIYLGKGAKKKN